MFVYRLRDSSRYLATNPKVMTSTLDVQDSLERFVSKRRYLHFALNRAWSGLGPDYTVICRNPFDRVESYFNEKLRGNVRAATADQDPYVLKRHQQIFYPWLGVTSNDSVEDQANALLGLTFERFIELLPEVLYDEDHLAPQLYNLTVRQFGIKLQVPTKQVVRIENQTEMEWLQEQFELDLSIRRNQSTRSDEIAWSEASISTIERLYQNDFATFGYPPSPPD